MTYRNIVDLHTHTEHSFDGHHTTDVLCRAAIEKGIKTLAFTDHLEMYAYYRDDFDKTAKESFEDTLEARERNKNELELLTGAEMGEAAYEKALSEEVMSTYNYDIVIGAIHNLPDKEDFYYMDLGGDMDFYPLLDEYFDLELDMARWDKFDTLAHLTYPLRYIVGKYHREADMSRYDEIIDEILLTLIKNGKALELNTAGYRQPIGVPSPNEEIVKRFRDLGGKYLTVGSDAHYDIHLGCNVPDAYDLAKRCGFDSVTVYRKREPHLITIE